MIGEGESLWGLLTKPEYDAWHILFMPMRLYSGLLPLL